MRLAFLRNLLFSSLLLAASAFGQISQLNNLPLPLTFAQNFGAAATNTCVASGVFQAAIKTITGTGSTATMVMQNGGLGGPAACGLQTTATGSNTSVTISITNTNTCYDGAQTITGITGAFTYTFASTCTTSFSNVTGANPGTPYEVGGNPHYDASGNLWVLMGYGNGTGDLADTISAKESTNNGTSFGGIQTVIADTALLCTGGTACIANGDAAGVAANGNIVAVVGYYDRTSATRNGNLYESIYNGTSWSATAQAATGIPAGQPSTWAWCYTTTQIFPMPGGALGLTATGDTGPAPTNCTGNQEYILVSCDNGVSWGTGTGCTGGMAWAAANPNILIMAGGWVTTEYNVAWIGGTTLLGFERNNPGTPGSPSPMIMFYSTNMGSTWTFVNTNIVGQAVGATTTGYTEVSPWLYNTGIGGLWSLYYGDRAVPGQYTQIVRQVTFNPLSVIANPTSFGAGQFVFGTATTAALGTYPGVVRDKTNPYLVHIASDEYPTVTSPTRRMRYYTGTYIPVSSEAALQHAALQKGAIQ